MRPRAGPITAPTLLWRLADDAVIVKVAACGAHSLALDAAGRVQEMPQHADDTRDAGRLVLVRDAAAAEQRPQTLVHAFALGLELAQHLQAITGAREIALTLAAGSFEVAQARGGQVVVAREFGATVLRGSLGYGQSARLHAHRPFGLDDNLPVVIEIVDAETPLRAFVETLSEFHDIGLITFEKVEVVRFGITAS